MELRSNYLAPLRDVEIRDSGAGEGRYTLEGHAAVYGRRSLNLGGFTEIIAAGAFRSVLAAKPDVHLLWQHDSTKALARTSRAGRGGSLELSEDGTGLKVWARVTPTSYSADLRALLADGVVDQMSFAFSTPRDGSGEKWERDEEGNITRTVTKVDGLFDVTIAARGAYPQTDVAIAGRDLLTAAKEAGRIPGLDRNGPALPDPIGAADFEAKRAAMVAEAARILAMAEWPHIEG